MWLMLQHDKPEDFVIATGTQHSVREFTELAFAPVGIAIIWQGEGINGKGIFQASKQVLLEVDPKYFRPTEVETLLANSAKAKSLLGWNPRQT